MINTGPDFSALQAIQLEPNETISYQGSPNLRQSVWHSFRILFKITFFLFLSGTALAFFGYQVPLYWAFGIYLVALVLLSLIDAYTDRNVFYCITNRRVIKLKAGKIEKQLRFDEIKNITHKAKDGRGFFLFSGRSKEDTVISFLGIEHVSAVYAALPGDLKKIAEKSNSALI